jgi:hypothetical protein
VAAKKQKKRGKTQGEVEAKQHKSKLEARLQHDTITAREEVYIAERIKPGVTRGDAAQRAGLASVPRRPQVERTVRKLIRKQLNLANIDAAAVVDEVKRMGMVNLQDVEGDEGEPLFLRELSEDTARAITGAEYIKTYEGTGINRRWTGYVVKVKTDKTRALEMLMKHFGQLEGTGKKGGDRLNEITAALREGPVTK